MYTVGTSFSYSNGDTHEQLAAYLDPAQHNFVLADTSVVLEDEKYTQYGGVRGGGVDGQWLSFTLTYKRSTKKWVVYQNGEVLVEGEYLINLNGYPFKLPSYLVLGQEQVKPLGGYDPTQGFVGSMDDVRVWSKALTAAEVKANYNVKLTGTETGLLAYYNFDSARNEEGPTLLGGKGFWLAREGAWGGGKENR